MIVAALEGHVACAELPLDHGAFVDYENVRSKGYTDVIFHTIRVLGTDVLRRGTTARSDLSLMPFPFLAPVRGNFGCVLSRIDTLPG